MLGLVKEIAGQKTIIPLTTDTGTGAPVGSLISQYKKVPMSGYLYCDGSTFDETAYPALYLYLGSNVLPDYRECVMVGAEQNTTDTIATHDVYTQGEFKDDQVQNHKHYLYNTTSNFYAYDDNGPHGSVGLTGASVSIPMDYSTKESGEVVYARTGTTTHGKQKAVYIYIKATSGLAENQQENVLNAVKDYVDNSNSYSTSEVLTGGKWVDGKPIYRKVISGISYWDGNLSIETGITNIDELINLSFIESGITGTYAGRIFVGTNRSESSWFINKSTGVVGTDGRSTSVTGTNGILIIEYTKTTD